MQTEGVKEQPCFPRKLPQSTGVDRVSPAGSGAVCQWHTIKAPTGAAAENGAIRMPPACRTPLREGALPPS